MQIRDIRTRLLSIPFVEPPQTGFLSLPNIDLVVVEVETASGVTGMGYLHPLAGGLRTIEMCIHEMLEPLLLNEDARDVERLWQKMWQATFIQGRMGITVMAMSALDIALWDAVGIDAGKPLWQLWGGRGDPLPVYGSGCYRGLGHDGMIEKAQRFLAEGYSAVKMQVAHCFTHAEDVANVRDMRAALGEAASIMVDVNQGWSASETIAVASQFEDCDIAWLEEPVMADDFEGYAQIAQSLRMPIASGENHFTHHDLKPFLQSADVRVLQPDVMRGGFTELRRIARLADDAGLDFAPHLFPELMCHVNAAVPNAVWLENMGWHEHLWQQPLLPERGFITPPDRPGHGLRFKTEFLSREFSARS